MYITIPEEEEYSWADFWVLVNWYRYPWSDQWNVNLPIGQEIKNQLFSYRNKIATLMNGSFLNHERKLWWLKSASFFLGTSWLFFPWCESRECGSLLGRFHLHNRGKESSGYGKIAQFSYILTTKQKNVLLKESCTRASFCSTLQNNLYSSTTLSLPIDFFSPKAK